MGREKKKQKTKEQKVKDMLLVIAQKQMPLPSKYDKVMIAVYIWSFSIIKNVMPLFDLHWLYVSILFVLAAIILGQNSWTNSGYTDRNAACFMAASIADNL